MERQKVTKKINLFSFISLYTQCSQDVGKPGYLTWKDGFKSRNKQVPEKQNRDSRTFNAKMKPRKYKLKEVLRRKVIEIYLDADKNEDRNRQGGSLL